MKRKVTALLLAAVMTVSLAGCYDAVPIPANEPVPDSSVEDPETLQPMVYADGALYVSTGQKSKLEARCGTLDGNITEVLPQSDTPSADGQANFTGGAGWQNVGEDTIDVAMEDGRWICFTRVAALSGAAERFAAQTGAELLSGRENLCYSPISFYYALSMAAAGASGETRSQLLGVLGAPDADTLARNCAALAAELTRDERNSKLYLANSLWVRENVRLREDYQSLLKEGFAAESFSVDFSRKTEKKMKNWVSDHTEGLLQPDFTTSPDTLMALLNTIYFRDAWSDAFPEESTRQDTFHTADGDVSARFMHQSSDGTAFTGDGYCCASLPYRSGGEMFFLLPEESYSLEEVLHREGLQNLLKQEQTRQNAYRINWSVPKFKQGAELDLIPVLQSLGVSDAFDPDSADLSAAFTDAAELQPYIGLIRQGTCLSVDETGTEAAAYTVILNESAAAMPPDTVLEMNLNRPFLYGVRSADGTLLFLGVCADPSVES